MCGRYRLTKRRMMEIEDYFGMDDIRELTSGKENSTSHLLK